MSFTPSPRQAAIFNHLLREPRHLLVQACAGSGKTTTIVEGCKLLPPGARVAALAFNKEIADTLQARLPNHIRSCTLHSLGFAALRRRFGPMITVNARKVRETVETSTAFLNLPAGDQAEVLNDLIQLIPLVRETLTDYRDTGKIAALAEQTGKIPDNLNSIPMLADIIDTLNSEIGTIDYTDMLILPLLHNAPMEQFELVLVDEAQDLNAVQHLLLRSTLAPGGRLVAVGDRRQSIYRFRGACRDSMDSLKRDYQMVELPLDVCYRCGKEIVALAQRIAGPGIIQPAEQAQDGSVVRRDRAQLEETLRELKPRDMIICRTNAPLVPVALRLLRLGIPATLRGRDIGAGLVSLVKRTRKHSVVEVLARAREICEKKVAKLRKQGQHTEGVLDQLDTLEALSEGCADASALILRIENLFKDAASAGIVLSTVHRAKGLEADQVAILAPNLLPAPWAKTEEEIDQERNLHYVAVTRARTRLLFQAVKLPKRYQQEEE